MERLGSPRNISRAQTDCDWRGLQSSSTISEQQSSANPRAAESIHQSEEELRNRLRSDKTFKRSTLHRFCVAR